ncbi:MAG: hypothetical protein DI527_17245 [Chelatococcus sp.]|nr:MAG: hypothetical protein DI527_17245 [Chelatococcus sp.]
MAISKIGAEQRVNTVLEFGQGQSDVAALNDGGFVVTWTDSSAQDAETYNYADIKARLYSAGGTASGGEIAVNANTVDEQDNSSVIGLADGGFAVAFEDGSDATVGGTYITARGFGSTGAAATGDLRIGGGSGDYLASHPQPLILSDDGLVVVHGTEGDGVGIAVDLAAGSFSQLYALSDSFMPEGGFESVRDLMLQSVAALPGGRFVHVFQGNIYDAEENSSSPALFAQLRNADGSPVAAPFQIDVSTPTTAGGHPVVTVLADGRFVVAWDSDADGADIWARIFDGAGGAEGGPFRVNLATAGLQGRPDIAALADGGFVVVWTDASGQGGDASGTSIKARSFDAAGAGDAAETLVNNATAGSQSDAHVAVLADGRFVVSWTDGGGAGGTDVKTQLFAAGFAPIDCPVVTRPGTQDGSAASADALIGEAGANSFLIRASVSSGHDTIANFGKADVFVTDAALRDSNHDGIITFGPGGLRIDGTAAGDTVAFTGLDPADGLRALGQSCPGVFVYADATVRPAGAMEGRLGADLLKGDAGDAKGQVFFFDTALKLALGADAISDFGAKDLLVTTTRIADGNNDGIIGFGADGVLDFAAGSSVVINGKAVASLEFDGAVSHGGVDYFVYSRVGSVQTGVNELFL